MLCVGGGDGDAGDGEPCVIKLRGLPFSTTVDDVLEFLGEVNVVNGPSGVHLTETRPGRPSGECYVQVASIEDVHLALKKDKENMGKRYIEVFESDAQEMGWAVSAHDNGDGFTQNLSDDMGVVRLRGLPFGCSKDEILKFFDGIEVASDGINILLDQTGRASGEAFVHFVDKNSAMLALDKDREKIGHRYIEVFPSSADEVRAYAARIDCGGGGGGGGGGGRMLGGRGYGRPSPYDRNDRYGGGGGRFSRGGGGGPGGGGRGGLYRGDMGWGRGGGCGGWSRGGGHSVHMRGLPFKASPQDIAYFFKPVRPVNINILFDNNNRPSGEADVEFECHEDALRAMRRDKQLMEHRYIELFLNSASFKNSYNRNLRTAI